MSTTTKKRKPKGPKHVELTRRETAELMGCHPDSLTRLLPDGLGAAVLRWGGHGKQMVFSRQLVERWDTARHCNRGRDGKQCRRCRGVLEDCSLTAGHTMAERHGVVPGCDECFAPWLIEQPIRHGHDIGGR